MLVRAARPLRGFCVFMRAPFGRHRRSLQFGCWILFLFALGQFAPPAVYPQAPLPPVQPLPEIQPLPEAQPLPLPAATPTMRKVRVWPRGEPGSVNAQWFPSADGRESIAVITGGINVLIEGIDPEVGTVDISTDRVVVWVGGDKPLDLSGISTLDETTPLELYMEGNIEFRQGERILQASRMYYDVGKNQGEILDAELLAPVPEYEGKVRIQAERMRQLSRSRFEARGAKFTTSRLGEPGYWLQSDDLIFEEVPTTTVDPLTGQRVAETTRMLEGRGNAVYIEGLPVFYWPSWKTDIEDPTLYLNNARISDDDIFGFQVQTNWNAYELLGIADQPLGTQWDLNADLLTYRGFGYGTAFQYDRGFLPWMTDDTWGDLEAWFIKDNGLDNLGLDRRALVPEATFRGRIRLDHQQRFGDGYKIVGQGGIISDNNFLQEYFLEEWNDYPDQVTRLRLSKRTENRMWEVQGNYRLNNFFTQVEWLPRGDHYWLGQSLLGDRFTWYEHTSLAYGKYRIAAAPTVQPNASQWSVLPWQVTNSGGRYATRQEIDLPLPVGPVKVVPYAMGELAHWDADIAGQPIDRAYGQVGLRTSLSAWSINPMVRSDLLNLNGLAHKVTFDTQLSYTDSSQNVTQFPLYDAINDDSMENFLNRLQSAPLGGPYLTNNFANISPFDPRYYLIRSGLSNWVTSPSTEVVDSLTAVQFDVRQRWQTKRGIPGNRRIVDWLTFDTGLTFFPEAQQNFGQYVGLINYDVRWHVGDRFTLLSDGMFDVFSEGQKLINLGGYLNRPDIGSAYLGVRSFEGGRNTATPDLGSQVALANIKYRMSPKYIGAYEASIDLAGTANVGQRIAFTRIGESFLVRAGLRYDMSKNNLGVALTVEPRLFRRVGKNQIEGIEVPPAGAYGIE